MGIPKVIKELIENTHTQKDLPIIERALAYTYMVSTSYRKMAEKTKYFSVTMGEGLVYGPDIHRELGPNPKLWNLVEKHCLEMDGRYKRVCSNDRRGANNAYRLKGGEVEEWAAEAARKRYRLTSEIRMKIRKLAHQNRNLLSLAIGLSQRAEDANNWFTGACWEVLRRAGGTTLTSRIVGATKITSLLERTNLLVNATGHNTSSCLGPYQLIPPAVFEILEKEIGPRLRYEDRVKKVEAYYVLCDLKESEVDPFKLNTTSVARREDFQTYVFQLSRKKLTSSWDEKESPPFSRTIVTASKQRELSTYLKKEFLEPVLKWIKKDSSAGGQTEEEPEKLQEDEEETALPVVSPLLPSGTALPAEPMGGQLMGLSHEVFEKEEMKTQEKIGAEVVEMKQNREPEIIAPVGGINPMKGLEGKKINLEDPLLVGYEVGTGEPVQVKPDHFFMMGQTGCGKTTFLEGLLKRSGYNAVVFKTKPGEQCFTAAGRGYNRIQPYLNLGEHQIKWYELSKVLSLLPGVNSINPSDTAVIMKVCEKCPTLSKIFENVVDEELKGAGSEVRVRQYIKNLHTFVRSGGISTEFSLQSGINVMDLSSLEGSVQNLVIQGTIREVIRKNILDIIFVIPEAKNFVPEPSNFGDSLIYKLISEGRAARRYLWFDSQDPATISKKLIRQASWFIGKLKSDQAKKVVENLKGTQNCPSSVDVTRLLLGVFYVTTREKGEEVTRKTYVKPFNLDDSQAKNTARTLR